MGVFELHKRAVYGIPSKKATASRHIMLINNGNPQTNLAATILG